MSRLFTRSVHRLAATACLGLLSGTTAALPVLSIDTDPLTAGIQSTLDVSPGDRFSVDVVVTDVVNLASFEIDIGFDRSVLTATNASIGPFFPVSPPFPLFTVAPDLSAPSINLDVLATAGFVGVSGDGVLASLGFTATGNGAGALTFGAVRLLEPFSFLTGTTPQIPVASTNSASVRSSGSLPVPAPGSAFLVAAGFLSLRLSRKNSSRKNLSRKNLSRKHLNW